MKPSHHQNIKIGYIFHFQITWTHTFSFFFFSLFFGRTLNFSSIFLYFLRNQTQNTKLKPKFSTAKHKLKTQNPNFRSCAFWETKHKPRIQTLELTTNPPPTSDSKLSNPKEINLISNNKTTSSLSHPCRYRCFLLARVCLGCGFKRIR